LLYLCQSRGLAAQELISSMGTRPCTLVLVGMELSPRGSLQKRKQPK
jgi:hypothetical protein